MQSLCREANLAMYNGHAWKGTAAINDASMRSEIISSLLPRKHRSSSLSLLLFCFCDEDFSQRLSEQAGLHRVAVGSCAEDSKCREEGGQRRTRAGCRARVPGKGRGKNRVARCATAPGCMPARA
ncbi:unnamed protein product [Symbiodinium natans]|uniref:Uncharacterized protein n=1 Tax=Symbiodinium natans TaxID=878477 RepID=A0A812JAM7_9DINO|nr:unnamed protein product [Symbiodinium natans]